MSLREHSESQSLIIYSITHPHNRLFSKAEVPHQREREIAFYISRKRFQECMHVNCRPASKYPMLSHLQSGRVLFIVK